MEDLLDTMRANFRQERIILELLCATLAAEHEERTASEAARGRERAAIDSVLARLGVPLGSPAARVIENLAAHAASDLDNPGAKLAVLKDRMANLDGELERIEMSAARTDRSA